MPEVLVDLAELPVGSHCLSFHTSREEAAKHAVDFVTGAPDGQAAAYWVADPVLQEFYRGKMAEQSPAQVGCVQVLDHEQVHPVDGKLRPVEEVLGFVGAHPEGVTAAGETLSIYWTPANVPDHLEYEAWFDRLPREESRFLCPYDLRRIPPENAPQVMRELGAHHSHVALSSSEEPAVRLLQLFVFETPAELPPDLLETLRWAIREKLILSPGPNHPMSVTDEGMRVVQAWTRTTAINW